MSDSPHLARAKKYREEAKRARELAAATWITDIREGYKNIARDYDHMAEAAERLAKRSIP